MSISVTKMPDDAIIILTMQEPFNPAEDVMAANTATAEFLEAHSLAKCYRIDDVRHIHIEFSDVVHGAAMAAKRGMPGSLADSRITTALVGTHEFAKLGAEAMGGNAYGNIAVDFFDSLDDAIAHAKQLLTISE